MKKRLVIGSTLLLVILVVAVGGVLIDPTYVLFGFLKNESFFHGRPTSYWREEIRRNSPEVHRSFGIQLGGEREPGAVPVLRALLHDEDDQICFYACNALAINGPDAKEAIPDLAGLLAHPNIYHRRNAASALAAITGVGDDDAIPPLIRGLQEEDTFVNYHCATALGRIGPNAKEAIPSLTKLSSSDRAGHDIFDKEATQATLGAACLWAQTQIDPKASLKEKAQR